MTANCIITQETTCVLCGWQGVSDWAARVILRQCIECELILCGECASCGHDCEV